MDSIKATFRTTFLACTDLTSIVNTRIYPKHISGVENPIFPCITISFEKVESNCNEVSEDGYYVIDIWSKNGNSELTSIHNLIKKLINKKRSLGGGIVYCRLYHANDDLYEEDTNTYHLCSKYQITSMDNFN